MEVNDRLGVVDEVLERAWVARELAVGFERRELGRLPLSAAGRDTTPYPAIHILEQSENETILHRCLQRLGGRVHWQHRLTALTDRPGGIVATAHGETGGLRIRARWCVGADGASSDVRRPRKIAYEGSTNERSYYVADAVGVDGLVADAVNERPARQDFLLTLPMGRSTPMGRSSAEPGAASHHRLLGAVRGRGDAEHDAPGSSSAGITEDDIGEMPERVYGVT